MRRRRWRLKKRWHPSSTRHMCHLLLKKQLLVCNIYVKDICQLFIGPCISSQKQVSSYVSRCHRKSSSGLGVLWWLNSSHGILAEVCWRGERLFQVKQKPYHGIFSVFLGNTHIHLMGSKEWNWRDYVCRPVDVWLRHFVRPFQNSYGWNLYREFWRVWVPLLLAPRYLFSFRKVNVVNWAMNFYNVFIGMGPQVWTTCQR